MLYVLIGPPASGKSTHAETNAREGDIIIDYDRLAQALTKPGGSSHQHPVHLAAVTRSARTAAIETAVRQAAHVDVYIIHSNPGPDRIRWYEERGAEIVIIDPGRDVVMDRCKRLRPRRMAVVVEEWYRKWTPSPTATLPTVTAIHANPMEL